MYKFTVVKSHAKSIHGHNVSGYNAPDQISMAEMNIRNVSDRNAPIKSIYLWRKCRRSDLSRWGPNVEVKLSQIQMSKAQIYTGQVSEVQTQICQGQVYKGQMSTLQIYKT